MRKRSQKILLVWGLAFSLLGACVLIPVGVSAARSHYPGSVAVSGEGLALDSRDPVAIHWQTTYLTTDDLQAVNNWYGARFGLSPGSDMSLSPVDNCDWLTHTKSLILVTHTATVLACTIVGGTRISVSQRVRLGP